MQDQPSVLAREIAGIIAHDPEAVAILRDALGLPEPESWVDVNAVAEHLACRRQRIYTLVNERRIPVHRDGSRLLFRLSEIDRWLTDG